MESPVTPPSNRATQHVLRQIDRDRDAAIACLRSLAGVQADKEQAAQAGVAEQFPAIGGRVGTFRYRPSEAPAPAAFASILLVTGVAASILNRGATVGTAPAGAEMQAGALSPA